jgi:ribose transport system substrate-binding protein
MREQSALNQSKCMVRGAVIIAVAMSWAGYSYAGDNSTIDQTIAAAGKTSDTSFCGSKPIVLGIHDGWGIWGWSKASMAAVRSEAAKCTNVKQIVAIGQGDLQKSITDISGMVSQGANAIVILANLGKAELPAIKDATAAGVKVVPWAADPGGVKGKDYVDFVDQDPVAAGAALAEWMAKALHGEGNVVYLGGPPGNPVSTHTLQGAVEALKKYPKISLLTGHDDWAVTNWDPAESQKTMTALLAKYPKIDGIINDEDGFAATGVLRAYESAGRPMVPMAIIEANQLACDYARMKPKNPGFELGTESARNWLGRIAARKAIAAAEGVKDDEPSTYPMPIYEDTLGGKEPTCDPKLPPDAYLSSQFTAEELSKYGKAE